MMECMKNIRQNSREGDRDVDRNPVNGTRRHGTLKTHHFSSECYLRFTMSFTIGEFRYSLATLFLTCDFPLSFS